MPFRARAQHLYYLALYLAAFVLTMPFNIASGSFLLVTLFWLLSLNPKDFSEKFKTRKWLWFSIAFLLLHAVSYFYSIDKEQSSMDIERKLCFLGLPLIIGCGPDIGRKNLENIFFAFVTGLSLSVCICFYNAISVWFKDGTTNQFFYHALVHGFDANAVYFSLYTVFSMALLMLYNWQLTLLHNKWLKYFLLLVQFIFFILLSAKILLLFFALILLPIYLFKTQQKKLFIPRVIGFVGAVIVFLIIISTNNPIRTRYQDILNKDENKVWLSNDPNGKHFNSLSLRLYLWKTAWENIQDNNLWWTGTGNGDVELYQKKKLQQYYSDKNPDWNTPLWEFNLHNEYFQVLMMLGIPGLTIFLIMVFSPLFFLRQMKNSIVFLIFFLSALIFMLQESAFQTQAALLFYTYFLHLFWNLYYTEKKKNIQKVTTLPLPHL